MYPSLAQPKNRYNIRITFLDQVNIFCTQSSIKIHALLIIFKKYNFLIQKNKFQELENII